MVTPAPPAQTAKTAQHTPKRDRSRRPSLPERTKMTMTDLPPADAQKPDSLAVDDVLDQLKATGSLEAAARRLAELAMQEETLPKVVQRRQEWEDDPEEAEWQSHTITQQEEDEEIEHLQQVCDGLWVGDLVAAMDVEGLRERGISNVVSLLRPRLNFDPEFAAYTIEIDDAQDTDILQFLPSTSAWIRDALLKRQGTPDEERDPVIEPRAPETKPGGVLVHCQAGMSRSATVAAAFLMSEMELDPEDAVQIVRDARPVVDPSETFWHQLGIYHQAKGRPTMKDRSTRQFYLERNTGMVLNLGGRPSMDHMAKYPLSPTASTPQTPAGATGRRKIRCKMCRRNLATREHMMDHILNQSGGPATRPQTPSSFALPQPMTTTEGGPFQPLERSNSVSSVINPLTGLPGARSRRASTASSRRPSIGAMSTISDGPGRSRSRSVLRNDGQLTMSRRDSAGSASGPSGLAPMTSNDKSEGRPPTPPRQSSGDKEKDGPERQDSKESKDSNQSAESKEGKGKESPKETKSEGRGPGGRPMLDADALAARLPPHLAALRAGHSAASNLSSPIASSPPSSPEDEAPPPRRRPSNLGMTSMPQALTPAALSALSQQQAAQTAVAGPPILTNNKCSGYFVEPLTWMEPQLESGQVSGKLICPCGAKIGTFDWAGVQCGCKEWVTPGFCIHRSRVDEVW